MDLRELEVAKGFDGPLRGRPEPVLLVAAYMVLEGRASLINRHVWRLPCPNGIPSSVHPEDDARASSARARLRSSTLALLFVAIEEDNGDGLSEVFAALERSEDLWIMDEKRSEALHLHDLPLDRAPLVTRAIPRLDGRGLDEICVGDDFIDAAWTTMPAGSLVEELRFHARSKDAHNDWTARLGITVK